MGLEVSGERGHSSDPCSDTRGSVHTHLPRAPGTRAGRRRPGVETGGRRSGTAGGKAHALIGGAIAGGGAIVSRGGKLQKQRAGRTAHGRRAQRDRKQRGAERRRERRGEVSCAQGEEEEEEEGCLRSGVGCSEGEERNATGKGGGAVGRMEEKQQSQTNSKQLHAD